MRGLEQQRSEAVRDAVQLAACRGETLCRLLDRGLDLGADRGVGERMFGAEFRGEGRQPFLVSPDQQQTAALGRQPAGKGTANAALGAENNVTPRHSLIPISSIGAGSTQRPARAR